PRSDALAASASRTASRTFCALLLLYNTLPVRTCLISNVLGVSVDGVDTTGGGACRFTLSALIFMQNQSPTSISKTPMRIVVAAILATPLPERCRAVPLYPFGFLPALTRKRSSFSLCIDG